MEQLFAERKLYSHTIHEVRYEARKPGDAPDRWKLISKTETIDDQINSWVDATGNEIVFSSAPGLAMSWMDTERTVKCIQLAITVMYLPAAAQQLGGFDDESRPEAYPAVSTGSGDPSGIDATTDALSAADLGSETGSGEADPVRRRPRAPAEWRWNASPYPGSSATATDAITTSNNTTEQPVNEPDVPPVAG